MAHVAKKQLFFRYLVANVHYNMPLKYMKKTNKMFQKSNRICPNNANSWQVLRKIRLYLFVYF